MTAATLPVSDVPAVVSPARTDVHRPSAMNPKDYRVLAVACVYMMEDLINGGDLTVCEMDGTDEWDAMGRPMDSTWTGHRKSQCDHCGARVKYTCVVLHVPTGDVLEVGRDCVGRFFNLNWSDKTRALEAAARRASRIAAFNAQYPHAAEALTWALEGEGRSNRFASEISEKVAVKGWTVSQGQADALVKALGTSRAPIAYKAGRRALSGVIVSYRIQEDAFAYKCYKVSIAVQTDEGFKVWGSLPACYADCLTPTCYAELEGLKGRRVSFTATVEAKDATFATYSRPAKFEMEARAGGGLPDDPAAEPTPEPEAEPVAEVAPAQEVQPLAEVAQTVPENAEYDAAAQIVALSIPAGTPEPEVQAAVDALWEIKRDVRNAKGPESSEYKWARTLHYAARARWDTLYPVN